MQTEEEAKYNSLKDCLNYILSKDFIADFFPNAFDQLHDSQEVFVDMKELMNVPIVENITNDLNMIMKALKENKKYSLDEEHNILKVHLSDRTTIMLRDIPDGTEQEEIKVLFGEFTDNITNMQPEVGNNYYVNFDTTEVTQKAFNLVRQQSFNGKSIGCCITSNFTFHNYAYPYVYIPPEYQENPYKNYNNDYKDGKKKFNNRKRKDFRKVGGPYNNSKDGGSSYNNSIGGGRGGNRMRGKKSRNDYVEQVQDIGEYWPPLPNSSNNDSKPLDFKKYTREQIVMVLNSMKDVKTPNWENECYAISEQINTELEFGKVLPSSYKNEWVEKVKGKNSKRNHRGSRSNERKDEVNHNLNEKEETPSVPVWPGRYKQKKEYVIKQNQNDQQTIEQMDSNTPNNPSYLDIVKTTVENTQQQETSETPKTNPETQPTSSETDQTTPPKNDD